MSFDKFSLGRIMTSVKISLFDSLQIKTWEIIENWWAIKMNNNKRVGLIIIMIKTLFKHELRERTVEYGKCDAIMKACMSRTLVQCAQCLKINLGYENYDSDQVLKKCTGYTSFMMLLCDLSLFPFRIWRKIIKIITEIVKAHFSYGKYVW